MDKISRREFIKIVGGSSVAIAGGAMLTSMGLPNQSGRDALTFRAVAGLPSAPLPGYASYVIEGGVNLANKTGVITKGVYAGPPDAMSNLALPGLSRNMRVIDATTAGNIVRITAELSDPASVVQGESARTTITIDTASRTARTDFLGRDVELQLA